MFWSPATYDYGATGTRPPQDLALKANLQLQGNQIQGQKDLMGQQQGFEGQQNALTRALQDAMQTKQIGSNERLQGNQLGFEGGQNELTRALQERMQGNQLNFQGTQAGLDRTQAEKLQGNALSNQLQIAGMPIAFARERFNTLLPMVSGALGGAMGSGGGGGGAMIGATGAPSSVYTPQQIDQQVNAMKAGNQQSAATQQRENAASNAAGGFGSSSPLLQALNQQAQLGAMSANTAGERDLRLNAAGANAKQGLGAATMMNQAQAAFQANANDAERNQLQARSSLVAALAGML